VTEAAVRHGVRPSACARFGALVVVVLLAAACGDDDAAAPTTNSTSTTTTTAAPTTSAAPTTVPPVTEPAVDPGEVRLDTIEVDDFVFDARLSGPAEGEPVFLLHGFPSTSDQWRHQIVALGEAGYRVIAPDQRGYSAGARPPDVEDYSIDLIAGDVVGMADALGIDDFHVVGHDFGGAAAWAVASLFSDRLLSVTSISTPHPAALVQTIESDDSDQAGRSSYVDTFVQPESELIFVANDAATLRSLYASQGLSEEEMEPQLSVLNDADAMRSALNWYRASFNASGLEVDRIDVPTMFIWSTGDQFLGPDPAHITGDFVDAGYRFEIIHDVNHWVPEMAADVVNPLLLDFLADPSALAPGEQTTGEHGAE
jgi:pimeloyl-ACP methyl ester carboxylesterase